ncbi:uncharacterized protein BDW70DRAFT_105017 [Aspergillus foveolatus]|uniref:uncharacterized protein n=1 Tax=Aspergillus foveolatus TaxID=210207 RepID=UPI003CCCAE30
MDGSNNQGQTPLSCAARCQLKKGKLQTELGEVEKVVEVLLEWGFPKVEDVQISTPLSRAEMRLPEGHEALILLQEADNCACTH